jgi:hypothetical protein
MSNNPILNHYVSEIDQFLQKFDAAQSNETASVLAERNKHLKIYAKRDHASENLDVAPNRLWKDF